MRLAPAGTKDGLDVVSVLFGFGHTKGSSMSNTSWPLMVRKPTQTSQAPKKAWKFSKASKRKQFRKGTSKRAKQGKVFHNGFGFGLSVFFLVKPNLQHQNQPVFSLTPNKSETQGRDAKTQRRIENLDRANRYLIVEGRSP